MNSKSSGYSAVPRTPRGLLLWGGVLLWTLGVFASLGWNIYQVRSALVQEARNQAEAALNTQAAVRHFVTRVGGVYVPIDRGVTPNKHLDHLEHRDIDTPVGKLTLVNSSFLVRLVDEANGSPDGLKVRAVSPDPLSPQNRMDAWESAVFSRLTVSSPARGELVDEQGHSWWRELRGRKATQACLGCHKDPTIKVGGLLGALSVRIPLRGLEAVISGRNRAVFVGHLLIWAMGIAAIVVGYRGIRRWDTQREGMQALLEEELQKERVLSDILHISISPGELYDKLRRILELTTRSPIADFAPKGAVFLTEPESRKLYLAVESGLDPVLRTACAEVAYGHCLCGRAAAEEQVVFAGCVDERHETQYHGMPAHGHYCIPIKGEERLLGVFTLYVAHGHTHTDGEERFLNSVADILGNLIDRHGMTEALKQQAFYDVLTGLPNRSLFIDRLRQRLRAEERGDCACSAILFLDLDGFKGVNDQHGHDQGDVLLREVAKHIAACVRPQDTVARFGGDEFTVLLDELEDLGSVDAISRRIHHALSQPVDLDGQAVEISTSIGVAFTGQALNTADDLLRAADNAMYEAKKQGKSQTWIYTPEMGAA